MSDRPVRLELDPQAAETRKREREFHLWTAEIPFLRALGFLGVAALLALGGTAVGAPPIPEIAELAGACLVYAGLSSAAIRLAGPGRAAERVGVVFLALDFVPIGAVLWLTGAESSLFFFLPIAHVANQASRGSGHVFIQGAIGTAAYVALFGLRASAGYTVDWRIGLAKAFVIAAVCAYIGVSARSGDRLRSRFALLFRTARELVAELQQKTRALEESREALHAQATRDAVTGLWNRSAILDVAERGLRRARHQGSPFAVVLADLDWFKDINDAYGHHAGDRALYETGRRMQSLVRPHDAVGRWGGEEFLIVLPDCGLTEAAGLAERLRAGLEAEEIRPAEAPPVSLTSSFGVAAVEPGESLSAEALVRAADHALYRAKRRGRNRVEVAEPETPAPVQPLPPPVP